jgi:hypothetical protein
LRDVFVPTQPSDAIETQTIINRGRISNVSTDFSSAGIQVSGGAFVVINNSGTISGDDKGIVASTGAGVEIDNSGTISGDKGISILIDANASSATIVNRAGGTLDGDVYLSSGCLT